MHWPLSLQRIKRKAKVFMGKRLVCHWKELSAVNLITTLLLPLHLSPSFSLSLSISLSISLSLSRSCSVSNSFLLSQSQSRLRERERVRESERDQCHPHHNQCGMFHQQKNVPFPVCMFDLAIHKVRQTLSRAPSLSKCFLIKCM